ncbi:hypothetical protein C0991_006173 [Blastosporella zonata]|nr:hypothetical protein C0991_006173 [Blastosporella zonata]
MVSLQDISFTFSEEVDYENPRFLTNIELKATCPDLGTVASLSAIQIHRRFVQDSFLEIMDAHSSELHEFSCTLFDKFGRVRPWLLEPGRRQGTGCWGNELNDGQIIYVSEVSVNEGIRGKGLGSLMLKKLVESQYVNDRDTLMCWPSPVGVSDKTEWKNLKEKQVAFFRKNGFRRVGRTKFFAYSPDPAHPSHTILETGDADEKGREFDGAADSSLSAEELEEKYLVKRAMGETMMSDTLEGYISKRKWGCTCGVCAGGWLSKRMRFRLQCDAGLAEDGMEMDMDSFERGVPYFGSLLQTDYLPPHIRRSGLFKTFYVGYQSIFDAIYNFLDRTDQPLSLPVIAARTLGARGVSFFFNKGGKIEYAFDAITHASMEQSPVGDDSFAETWDEHDSFTALPTCANDLEFSLVRQRLGLDPRGRWGPYREYDDDAMDEDDEDDDDSMDEDDEDDDNDMGSLFPGERRNPQVIEAIVRQLMAERQV